MRKTIAQDKYYAHGKKGQKTNFIHSIKKIIFQNYKNNSRMQIYTKFI